jgi:hypothetical protein
VRLRGRLLFMDHGRWPLGPFLVVIIGLLIIAVLNFSYTNWALASHSHQACAQLRIMATTKGATTSYDRAVRAAYQRLYRLRCG